jgi:predicted NUDIX family NTP pyrophosphohydrolase
LGPTSDKAGRRSGACRPYAAHNLGVPSMSAESAGILMFKREQGRLFVLLAHPGGPFWRQKDEGAWSIPKGERAADETSEAAARREFAEELGAAAAGPLRPLGKIRQRGRSRCRG